MNNEIAILLIAVSILIMVFSMMGVLVWYFLFFRFKHSVELIYLHNNSEKIKYKKARDHILSDSGAKIWRLRWCNDIKELPVPPDDVIKTTDKGKNFVRVYVTETGDIIYANSKHPRLIAHYNESLKNIPDWIENIPDVNERQKQYDKWKLDMMQKMKNEAGDNYIVFKPYTTNHRVMQVLQVHKAHERKNKSFGDKLQMILNVLPTIVLAFVVIIGIVFWQDLAEPNLEKQAQLTQQKALEVEQWRIIQQIDQNIQEIKTELESDSGGGGSQAPY